MISGIFAGVAWALETVVLGIALGMTFFNSTPQLVLLAPFIATFLHDAFSALYMLIFNTVRGEFKSVLAVLKGKSFKWIALSSAIGGPVGMTGYVLTVNYLGASIGAVASAVYPAIGTLLAFIFLKERVRWYQWIFLLFTLLGVFGLSYSPTVEVGNLWLGILGAFMCAFGWGIEAVILAKCLKDPEIKNEQVLQIRQSVSALIYVAVILPITGGLGYVIDIAITDTGWILPTIALAGLFATVSYLFYYKTIGKLGAAKAMALNITYTAWAIIFTVVLLWDFSVLNPLTICLAAVVVVCGVFAAASPRELFLKCNDK